jgi:hypothetical protein
MAALSIARAYQHSFHTRPNVTLALTGGSLNAFADFVAQVAQNAVSPLFLDGSHANDEDANFAGRPGLSMNRIVHTTMLVQHVFSALG